MEAFAVRKESLLFLQFSITRFHHVGIASSGRVLHACKDIFGLKQILKGFSLFGVWLFVSSYGCFETHVWQGN